jgi:hypothetical protein
LRSRFVKGILQASQDFERISFRAKCTITHQNITVSEKTRKAFAERRGDPFALTRSEFDCAVRNGMCLVHTENKQGLQVFKVRNPSYAFAITRASPEKPATVQFLERPGVDPAADARIAEVEKNSRGVVFGAFCLWGTPLSQLVQSREFKINRAYGGLISMRRCR